jgi:hypothetical protein
VFSYSKAIILYLERNACPDFNIGVIFTVTLFFFSLWLGAQRQNKRLPIQHVLFVGSTPRQSMAPFSVLPVK